MSSEWSIDVNELFIHLCSHGDVKFEPPSMLDVECDLEFGRLNFDIVRTVRNFRNENRRLTPNFVLSQSALRHALSRSVALDGVFCGTIKLLVFWRRLPFFTEYLCPILSSLKSSSVSIVAIEPQFSMNHHSTMTIIFIFIIIFSTPNIYIHKAQRISI